MAGEDGRVTFLPQQIRRLAELSEESPVAIEVVQYGSVLQFNNGSTKLRVDADGNYIHPSNQESLW